MMIVIDKLIIIGILSELISMFIAAAINILGLQKYINTKDTDYYQDVEILDPVSLMLGWLISPLYLFIFYQAIKNRIKDK